MDFKWGKVLEGNWIEYQNNSLKWFVPPTMTFKYNHYYFTPWEFFTSVLADGLSLKFEWQQVSLFLRDSSQYSG